ncbi:hypothetical protein [Sodalis sp. (in: enterobacteria)]
MLHPELGDASLSEQHFRPKQAYQNSIIPYYSTKPLWHELTHSSNTTTPL